MSAPARLSDEDFLAGFKFAAPRNSVIDDFNPPAVPLIGRMIEYNGEARGRFPQELLHPAPYASKDALLRDVWKGWIGENVKGTKRFLQEVVVNSTNIIRLFPLMRKEELIHHPLYQYFNDRFFSQNITMAPGVMQEASAKAPAMDVEEDIEIREQHLGSLYKDNFKAPMDYPVNKLHADRLNQRCALSSKNASLTWEWTAVRALAETGRKEMYDEMVRRLQVRQPISALRRYIKFTNARKFALMKNGSNFLGLMSKVVGAMRSESRPTDAMFPHGTTRNLQLRADALDYSKAGPLAERNGNGSYATNNLITSNLSYVGNTLYGIRVSEVMPFKNSDGTDAKHPLERTTYTSQFMLMSGRQSKAPAPHSSIRDISVFNMTNGTEVTLPFEDALFNSSVYEPDVSGLLTPGGRALLRLLTRGAAGVNSIESDHGNPMHESFTEGKEFETTEDRTKANQESHFARLINGPDGGTDSLPDTAFSFGPSDDSEDTDRLSNESRLSAVDQLGLGVNLHNLCVSAGNGSTEVLDLLVQQMLHRPETQREFGKLLECQRNGKTTSIRQFAVDTHNIEQNNRFRVATGRAAGKAQPSFADRLALKLSADKLPTSLDLKRAAKPVLAAKAALLSRGGASAASHSAAAYGGAAARAAPVKLAVFGSNMVNVHGPTNDNPFVQEMSKTPLMQDAAKFSTFAQIVQEVEELYLSSGSLLEDCVKGALPTTAAAAATTQGLVGARTPDEFLAIVRGSVALDFARDVLIKYLTQSPSARVIRTLPTYSAIKKDLSVVTVKNLQDAVAHLLNGIEVDEFVIPSALKAAFAHLKFVPSSSNAETNEVIHYVWFLLRKLANDTLSGPLAYEIAIFTAYLADLNTKPYTSSIAHEEQVLAQLVGGTYDFNQRRHILKDWIESPISVAVCGDMNGLYKTIIEKLGGDDGVVPENRQASFILNVSKLMSAFLRRCAENLDQYTQSELNELRALFIELLTNRTSTNIAFLRVVVSLTHDHDNLVPTRFAAWTDEYLIGVAKNVIEDDTNHPDAKSSRDNFAKAASQRSTGRVASATDSERPRYQSIDCVTRDPNQLKRLLMRVRITREMWRRLGRNNLTMPASFLIPRPWIEIVAISAMLFKAGAETGFMAISNASVAYAEELHTMEIEVQVQFNANLLIHKPANIAFLPDVFPSKYIQGGGVTYNNIRDNPSIFFSNTVERADLLSFIVPYNWLPEEAFVPINGQMDPRVTIIDNPKEAYPTAQIYRDVIWHMDPYNLAAPDDNMYSFVGWGRKAPTLEWRLDRAFYRYTGFSVTKGMNEERDVLGEDCLGRHPTVGDVGLFGHATEFAGTGFEPLGSVRRDSQF